VTGCAQQVRPLLTDTDKRWLAYQLLEAVATMHACGVRHGDIKAENVLVTSWNWLLLSDLAPYKPVYIDLENPADFTYYFDTCGRRRCYLAPERFVAGAAAARARVRDSHVTAAMDVFSVGCTVAELLTQEPLFQYSDMVDLVRRGRVNSVTEVCSPQCVSNLRSATSAPASCAMACCTCAQVCMRGRHCLFTVLETDCWVLAACAPLQSKYFRQIAKSFGTGRNCT
jgi:serine/threonine protein kinase